VARLSFTGHYQKSLAARTAAALVPQRHFANHRSRSMLSECFGYYQFVR
jgi:hypothetical protein